MATPGPMPVPPAAPNRGDAPADFSQKADASTAYWPVMTAAINVRVTYVDAQVAAALDYRNAAAQSAQYAEAAADRAEAVDTNVSEQVAAAEAAANNAAASAAAAESAPGSIGNLALLHALTIAMR
ncbi:hypothetical protein AABC73_20485 [Pseudomonas sp. G.S.17]|uniref:hypothetical protein n=1 Tax=Pseudomonas sp. G.S.17 TaxID=3137451 RepID=UPI00311CCC20